MKRLLMIFLILIISACGERAQPVEKVDVAVVAKSKIESMYDLETRKKIWREIIYAERRADKESGAIDAVMSGKKPTKEQVQKRSDLEDEYSDKVLEKYKITQEDFNDISLEAYHNMSTWKTPPIDQLKDE